MLKITPQVTRIDFEKTGDGVTVKYWNGKWKEVSAPAVTEFLSAVSIDRLLMYAEDHGKFTCEMARMDGSLGRALRGEITRIDIMELLPDKWKIKKFPRGWTAKTRPIEEKTVTEKDAQFAIDWCKSQVKQWKVREFPGGARAWKGEVKPIRDAATIMRLRRQVTGNFNRGEIDERRQFDFAFDC